MVTRDVDRHLEPMSDLDWTPESWRDRKLYQPVDWDAAVLEKADAELRRMPPLIAAGEADRLTRELADVQAGRAFALFAGDCAESFDELTADRLRDQLKLFLQMSIVLTFGAQVPVVKLGRMAGQFAKPRSSLAETRDGVTLAAFRGHSINDAAFTADARQPDALRMLHAYHHSASALNLVRAFTAGGFADLGRVHAWNLDFVRESPEGRRYEELAARIDESVRFAEACGTPLSENSTHVYTAHEALVLDYEEALTRRDSISGEWYGCSGHFLWIGERTRQPEGAHIEYARGIKNPIGVKVGPEATPDEVVDLVRTLNPGRVPGRLTLTTRLGAGRVREVLPGMVEAVRAAGEEVIWVCDPMHGNTTVTSDDIKTRDLAHILEEIRGFVEVLHAHRTWPGGIHLEITPDNVTECTGGSWPVTPEVLHRNYRTLCDPRLNGRQALDLAFATAEMLVGGRRLLTGA